MPDLSETQLSDLDPGTQFAVALTLTGPNAHRVGDDTVDTAAGPVRVSTILNYGSLSTYSNTVPYETALFAGGEMIDGVGSGYQTREEAEAGHASWLERLRAGELLWSNVRD